MIHNLSKDLGLLETKDYPTIKHFDLLFNKELSLPSTSFILDFFVTFFGTGDGEFKLFLLILKIFFKRHIDI